MSNKSDELISEVHDILISDRERISTFLEEVTTPMQNASGSMMFPPPVEAVSRLFDNLTKNNAQLVELAKLQAGKENKHPESDKFSEDESDAIMSEIENGNSESPAS